MRAEPCGKSTDSVELLFRNAMMSSRLLALRYSVRKLSDRNFNHTKLVVKVPDKYGN